MDSNTSKSHKKQLQVIITLTKKLYNDMAKCKKYTDIKTPRSSPTLLLTRSLDFMTRSLNMIPLDIPETVPQASTAFYKSLSLSQRRHFVNLMAESDKKVA